MKPDAYAFVQYEADKDAYRPVCNCGWATRPKTLKTLAEQLAAKHNDFHDRQEARK